MKGKTERDITAKTDGEIEVAFNNKAWCTETELDYWLLLFLVTLGIALGIVNPQTRETVEQIKMKRCILFNTYPLKTILLLHLITRIQTK